MGRKFENFWRTFEGLLTDLCLSFWRTFCGPIKEHKRIAYHLNQLLSEHLYMLRIYLSVLLQLHRKQPVSITQQRTTMNDSVATHSVPLLIQQLWHYVNNQSVIHWIIIITSNILNVVTNSSMSSTWMLFSVLNLDMSVKRESTLFGALVAHWQSRYLSTGGSSVRIPLYLPRRDLGQVLHS